ncbi:MAG: DUF4149 domain-containing protein [Candidatus Thorarchaeota archaeon]|nr:MAG: DUF4149 domain-containing protein [Candidatus Thorarchaeota archaeon]
MATPIQLLIGFMNWLHLIATVAWFGGLTVNVLILMPSMQATLDPPTAGKLLNTYMGRFRRLVYVSILVLVLTGAAIAWIMNPAYLELSSEWSIIMAIKHVIVAIAIIATLYSFEILAPKVARLAAQGPSPELAKLQQIQMTAARVAFIVALLILLLTGIQTAL